MNYWKHLWTRQSNNDFHAVSSSSVVDCIQFNHHKALPTCFTKMTRITGANNNIDGHENGSDNSEEGLNLVLGEDSADDGYQVSDSDTDGQQERTTRGKGGGWCGVINGWWAWDDYYDGTMIDW